MDKLSEKIDSACAQYFNEELDETGFQNIIDEIPSEMWQETDSALSILRTLVENEDLYEVSLNKCSIFSNFVCALLPKVFWDNTENILGAADLILRFMAQYCDYASSGDIEGVFEHVPQRLWDDSTFVTAAADLVTEWAYKLDDLVCISDLIPESVWKNENDLRWIVLSIYNADERNMACLSLFPQKVWESAEQSCLVLSCLADALENDRAWGTMYPNFRGSDEEYLEDFLSYVPDSFKSNTEFIIGLLEIQYFSEVFHVVYDWIEQNLWEDKEFVMSVLEMDCEAASKVSDELLEDDDIRTIMDEYM